MFGILGWILFGLVAGIVAKLLMPGRDPGGFIVTILLGIAGAGTRRVHRPGDGLVPGRAKRRVPDVGRRRDSAVGDLPRVRAR